MSFHLNNAQQMASQTILNLPDLAQTIGIKEKN